MEQDSVRPCQKKHQIPSCQPQLGLKATRNVSRKDPEFSQKTHKAPKQKLKKTLATV